MAQCRGNPPQAFGGLFLFSQTQVLQSQQDTRLLSTPKDRDAILGPRDKGVLFIGTVHT